MTEAAEEELGKDIRDLATEVRALRSSFARVKATNRVQAAVIVGMIVLGVLYYLDVRTRRADTQGRIRDLACFAVRLRPGGYSPTTDALRAKYDCPPFVATPGVPVQSKAPSTAATPPTPNTPAPSASSTVEGLPEPTPSPRPSATITPPRAVRSTPAATRTVRAPPRPARTTTRTVTRTSTPSPTSTGLLPGLLCNVLGLPLCP